jgi:hypothetical protein
MKEMKSTVNLSFPSFFEKRNVHLALLPEY